MKNNESKIEKLEKQLADVNASSQENAARIFDDREKELLQVGGWFMVCISKIEKKTNRTYILKE